MPRYCRPVRSWRYSMRRDMQEIIHGLFLGPFSAASKSKLNVLETAGITHILCVRHHSEANFIQPIFPERFVYQVIDIVDDAADANLILFLPQVKEFINDCLKARGKILVHGNAGISRSAALVIGYLMEHIDCTYEEALAFVRRKRVCVRPHESFKNQLEAYEAIYKAKKSFPSDNASEDTGKYKRTLDQLAGGFEALTIHTALDEKNEDCL